MLEHIRMTVIRLIAGKMPVMVNVTLRRGEIPNAWSHNCRFEGMDGSQTPEAEAEKWFSPDGNCRFENIYWYADPVEHETFEFSTLQEAVDFVNAQGGGVTKASGNKYVAEIPKRKDQL